MLLSPLRSPLQPALRGPLQARVGGSSARILDFGPSGLTAAQQQSRLGWVRSGAGTLTDVAAAVRYGAHNLLLHSAVPSNAAWTKGNATVSGGLVTATAGNSHHVIFQPVTGLTANTPFVFYARLTAGTHRYAYVALSGKIGGTNWAAAVVDFQTNTLTQTSNGAGASGVTSSISVDGGIVTLRVGITSSETGYDCVTGFASSGSPSFAQYAIDSFTATGTETFTFVAGQLSFGSPALDYVPTTTAPVYLMLTPDYSFGVPGLLLQGARTNLAPTSENVGSASWSMNQTTVSQNAGIAPDSTLTADKMIVDSGLVLGPAIFPTTARSIVSGTVYTASVFAKAAEFSILGVYFQSNGFADNGRTGWINLLTGATQAQAGVVIRSFSLPNGWWRISITATADATVTAFTFGLFIDTALGASGTVSGNGASGILVWGAEFVEGAYPTSYIPNPGTGTLLRVSDSLSQITGSELSNLIGDGSDFVLVFNFVPLTTSGIVLELSGAADRAVSTGVIAVGGTLTQFYGTGFSSQANLSAPIVVGQLNKLAIGYANNRMRAVINGGTVQVDTSGSVPGPLGRLAVASTTAVLTQYNDLVAGRLVGIPGAGSTMTDAALQALTV